MHNTTNRKIRMSRLSNGTTNYIVVAMLSFIAGFIITLIMRADVIPDLLTTYKKTTALIVAFILIIYLSLFLRSVTKSLILLFPVLLGLNFALFPIVDLRTLPNPNFTGYPQNILIYEPLLLLPYIYILINKLYSGEIYAYTKAYPIIFYSIFFILSSISVILAQDKADGILGIVFLAKFLLWFIAFRYIFQRDTSLIYYFFVGLLAFVFIQATIGSFQFLGIRTFEIFTKWSPDLFVRGGYNRVAGTMGRSPLDITLAITLPILLGFSLSESRERRKFLFLVIVSLGYIVLFMTKTRIAIASSTVGFFIVLYFLRKEGLLTKKFLNSTTSLIVISSIIGGFIFFSGGNVLNTILRPTWISRGEQDIVALRMFIDRPVLGVGLNNYLPRAADYGASLSLLRFARPVHSQYLLVLSESGILAFIFFALFLISCLKCTGGIATAPNNAKYLKIGIRGSFVSLVVASFVTIPLISTPCMIILAAFLAIICLKQDSYLLERG